MKTKSVSKKVSFIVLIILVVSLLVVYGFFRYQIEHILGGNTEVVERSQFTPIATQLAIKNVSVLSADSSEMTANLTVLVSNKSIEYLGENPSIPANYHVIDGTGKYLIPGLIDAHVHIKKSPNDLLLYLANGVTQIGEMTGMAHHFKLQDNIAQGGIGPNMFIASPKMTSQSSFRAKFRSGFEQRHKNYLTPAAARKAVRDFKKAGYNAIKISSFLSHDIYLAINHEAKQVGLPVIGHLPVGFSFEDLYQSGQSQIAHITSITQSEKNQAGWYTPDTGEQYLKRIAGKADAIAKALKQNDITVASTAWLFETLPQQQTDLPGFLTSIPLAYQNPGWLEGSVVSGGWLPKKRAGADKMSPKDKQYTQVVGDIRNKAIEIVTQALVRHGVTITAGTDAHGAVGMIAGFSLHNELQRLNDMGLSPSQVLQSATRASAKWMKIKTGVIAAGYRADLLLLNQNPLDNISHSKSIEAVITNGNYLNRQQLDEMLAAVKTANNNSRKISIDAYLTPK